MPRSQTTADTSAPPPPPLSKPRRGRPPAQSKTLTNPRGSEGFRGDAATAEANASTAAVAKAPRASPKRRKQAVATTEEAPVTAEAIGSAQSLPADGSAQSLPADGSAQSLPADGAAPGLPSQEPMGQVLTAEADGSSGAGVSGTSVHTSQVQNDTAHGKMSISAQFEAEIARAAAVGRRLAQAGSSLMSMLPTGATNEEIGLHLIREQTNRFERAVRTLELAEDALPSAGND